MEPEAYRKADATELARARREGEVSTRSLVELAQGWLAKWNPAINAVVRSTPQELLDIQIEELDAAPVEATDAQRRPFAGVPFLYKDLHAARAGERVSAASLLTGEGLREDPAEISRRLDASGLLSLGRTNCSEFGILGHTESKRWGACRNPWNLRHNSGGSSGGSGAAVAAGIVPLAHAGDGAGSIRIPASNCGLVGLKPTRGRSPGDSGWNGLVVEHVLCRSLRDCATALEVVSDEPSGAFSKAIEDGLANLGSLRVAWSDEPLFRAHPRVGACAEPQREALARACEALKGAGHELHEMLPPIDRDRGVDTYFRRVTVAVAASLREVERSVGRTAQWGDLEPATWLFRWLGERTSMDLRQAAKREQDEIEVQLESFFGEFDLFICPTTARPAVRNGELEIPVWERAGLRALGGFASGPLLHKVARLAGRAAFGATPNTMLFNIGGQPALSLPFGRGPLGLPTGIQFVARQGREDLLFAVAEQLHRAGAWRVELPDHPA